MRACAIVLVPLAALLALAPEARGQAPVPAAKQKAAPAPARSAPKRPAPGSPRAVYDAMSEAERMLIQSELIWTGDYNGMADGSFDEGSIAAVKAFQKRNAGKETGILNPDERQKLAQAAKVRQDRVGWRMLDDKATGARLGVPGKLAPQSSPTGSGTRWQSARGEVQVETFRITGTTLAQAFERQKKEPPQRKPDYQVLKPDFFVLSGLQGLKKFYVRAHIRDDEVRGVAILYDQAMEGIVEPIAVAVSNTFAPFPSGGVVRPKVEYGTGIVVSPEGHVLTDRRLADECRVIVVPGHGHADKLAEEADLALLRLYGARGLAPVALAPEGGGGEVTLVGVAEPQAQAGGGAVSTAAARLAQAGGAMTVAPTPSPGFSGGAAIDRAAGLLGLVLARPATGPAQPALVPAEQLKSFLAAHDVPVATGRSSIDAAKAAAVRVICVRE
jgi:peptidoglycan hydrolase-like protein with peptidoglycan-binding domain